MAKIIKSEENLIVSDNPFIPIIPGDGVGSEIWETTHHVVDTTIKNTYQNKREYYN